MKKGLELPINVLVIVAVAVVVLLGVSILFMTGFLSGGNTLNQSNSWNQACVQVKVNCAQNYANTPVTTLVIGTQQVSKFGEMCGALGRYDNSQVTYSAADGWTANTGSTVTDAADTSQNGCNVACGC